MTDPQEFYNESFEDLTRRVLNLDPATSDASTAFKNLKTFSEVTVPGRPKPPPTPEPTSRLGKAKAAIVKALDNETTRVAIKSLAYVGGVMTVTYATIRKDHVLERQALDQARQRPIQ